jgi:hypothetical protein
MYTGVELETVQVSEWVSEWVSDGASERMSD